MIRNAVKSYLKGSLTKVKDFFFLITFRDSCNSWRTYAILLFFMPVIWAFILVFGVAIGFGCAVFGLVYYFSLILIRLLPLLLALAALGFIISIL